MRRSRPADRRRRTAAAMGVLALALTACESAVDRVTESAVERIDGVDGMEIDRDGENLSFETEEGSFSAGASQEVPDALAAEIDLPDAFEPVGASEGTEDGTSFSMVTGPIRGDREALAAQLDAAVAAGSWDEAQEIQMGEMGAAIRAWGAEREGVGLQVQLAMEDDADEGQITATLFVEQG